MQCLRRLLRRKLFAIALGVTTSMFFMEGALRVVYDYQYNPMQNDPKTGLLTYAPGGNYHARSPCFANTVKINSWGFNSREFSVEKRADTFRILVIGSSFVDALQVPQDQHFAVQLEKQLNTLADRQKMFEVIPFGFSGNGTYLNIAYYAAYAAMLRSDLVIDLSTEYEMSRNGPGAKWPPRFDAQGEPVLAFSSPANSSVKNLVRSSWLAMNLYEKSVIVKLHIVNFLRQPYAFVQYAPRTAEIAHKQMEFWDTETRLLSALARRVKRDDANFFLISWFTPYAEAGTAERYSGVFRTIAAANDFDYLDLTPMINARSQASGMAPNWTCDGHWTANGHAWVADEIFRYFDTHRSLIGLW